MKQILPLGKMHSILSLLITANHSFFFAVALYLGKSLIAWKKLYNFLTIFCQFLNDKYFISLIHWINPSFCPPLILYISFWFPFSWQTIAPWGEDNLYSNHIQAQTLEKENIIELYWYFMNYQEHSLFFFFLNLFFTQQ